MAPLNLNIEEYTHTHCTYKYIDAHTLYSLSKPIYLYACLYVCMHVYMLCVFVPLCLYMYECACICMCVYVYVYVRTYVCTHMKGSDDKQAR